MANCASRVLDHPSLIVSSHAATTPPIPDMLQTMKVLPCQPGPEQPVLPLSGLRHTFSKGKIQQQFAHGRVEYLYCADVEILERCETLYAEHATKISEAGSKMSPKNMHQLDCENNTSQISRADQSLCNTGLPNSSNQSRLSIGSRDLPKWMMKKEPSKESVSGTDESFSDESHTKFRKLMYVMTDKELVDTACDVLKQAGKEELVKQFLSQQMEKTKSDIDTSSKLNAMSNNGEQKVENNDTKETRKYNKEKRKVSVTSKRTTCSAGDQPSSFCPKMEPESDIGGFTTDLRHGIRISENQTSVKKVADVKETHPDENVMKRNAAENCESRDGSSKIVQNRRDRRPLRSGDRHWEVEDVVGDVLDQFSTSNIPPKHSPRKRSRHKEEMPSERKCKLKKQHYIEEAVNDLEESEVLPRKRTVRQIPDLSYLDDIF